MADRPLASQYLELANLIKTSITKKWVKTGVYGRVRGKRGELTYYPDSSYTANNIPGVSARETIISASTMNTIKAICNHEASRNPLSLNFDWNYSGVIQDSLTPYITKMNQLIACHSNCYSNCHSNCHSNCQSSSSCADNR